MHSEAVELHPNWYALSTASFPIKRFVRGLELQSAEDIPNKQKYCSPGETNGVEVQQFYEKLIIKSENNNICSAPLAPACQSFPAKHRNSLDFDRNKFFRFATSNNVKELARFNYQANNINVCDEFGWTALMMAACEGATDAVRMLLESGADKSIKEKSGRTALDFAKQKKHENIAIMLQSEYQNENTHLKRKQCSSVISNVPFYCSLCNLTFSDTSQYQHQTSTLHQFNMKPSKCANKLNKFNISSKNRGLQLMVKQGWDKESGLGPTQTGRLYPIKTVIRKKRSGLGTDQEPARVTHFGANDLQATKHNKSFFLHNKKRRSRNDIRSEKLREWKRERRLRRELS
ncbi:G patch domain and ankyrin repeat-containing protein 1 homolog [Anastrepha ludens]|uniref:G patch domain and ankyrin repeat-containing protein 1 homolog n=1 Tax=Anastrepha ludens TaxID=28586 RepID=UPI0023B0AB69|nr:G patch domain and ankyrin repeat-containing protein 1 homolog [Anastrepha ludens]